MRGSPEGGGVLCSRKRTKAAADGGVSHVHSDREMETRQPKYLPLFLILRASTIFLQPSEAHASTALAGAASRDACTLFLETRNA